MLKHYPPYVDQQNGWTVTDLAERFGSIPISRVCMDPPPGTATEDDVVRWRNETKRLFELIDGTLLEKTVGSYESYLAMTIGALLHAFVSKEKLGFVLGEAGMLKLAPGLVRIPDVSFISKERMPNFLDPNIAIADVAPDLAVEVISASNTTREMDRKLIDYFEYNVRLVWYVYPTEKRVDVFTGPEARMEITDQAVLDGGVVLPSFSLALNDLFANPF